MVNECLWNCFFIMLYLIKDKSVSCTISQETRMQEIFPHKNESLYGALDGDICKQQYKKRLIIGLGQETASQLNNC